VTTSLATKIPTAPSFKLVATSDLEWIPAPTNNGIFPNSLAIFLIASGLTVATDWCLLPINSFGSYAK
jgi:hypothetical protein